jgi:antitoxin (DNA-binding transcriptional repressor) of toxin-antitoxin stability system
MKFKVSISDLRNNISDYLEKVMKGTQIFVRDEKRGITVAELVQTSTFDKVSYEKILRKTAGIFSEDNHPEWKTKKDVINWVTKNRISDERNI